MMRCLLSRRYCSNGSWARSTPATDGKSVYFGGMRDELVKLDADSQPIWAHIGIANQLLLVRSLRGLITLEWRAIKTEE